METTSKLTGKYFKLVYGSLRDLPERAWNINKGYYDLSLIGKIELPGWKLY